MASQAAAINVKILSQLPQPDHVQFFEALPVATTVKDLKLRLSQKVSAKPSPDHMRLIYLGRLLAPDSATLADIFNANAAQQENTYTIHMVLRDNQRPNRDQHAATPERPHVPNAGHPGLQLPPFTPAGPHLNPAAAGVRANLLPPNTIPPHMFNNQQAPIVQPQSPFGHTQGTAIQFPPQAPVIPPQLPLHPNGNNLMHFHLQQMQAHQRHMTQLQQQQMPHGIHQSGAPAAESTNSTSHHRTSGQDVQAQATTMNTRQPSPSLREPLNSNQSASTSSMPTTHGSSTSQSHQQANAQAPSLNGNAGGSGNGNMTFQETVGPNGQRFMMAFGTTNMPMSLPNVPPNLLHHGMVPPMVPTSAPGRTDRHTNMATQSPGFISNWSSSPLLGTTGEYFGEDHAIQSMRQYQGYLDDMCNRIRNHSTTTQTPSPQIAYSFNAQIQGIIRNRNRAQDILNRLLTPGQGQYQQGLGADAVNALQVLNETFTSHVREALRNIAYLRDPSLVSSVSQGATESHSTLSESRSSLPDAQLSVPSENTNLSVRPVTAYLLNSPNGPHAIVFTPEGTFSNGASVSFGARTSRRPGQMNIANASGSMDESLARNRLNVDRIARAYQTLNDVNRDLQSMQQSLTNAVDQIQQQGSQQRSNRDQTHQDEQQALEQVANQLQNVQQQVEQRQLQARDEANADLLPLLQQVFRHLWLMIRVFGCIWLLTRGASTRRTILLLTSTIIYFLVQAGAFGERPFERLRQWFEQVIGVEEGRQGAQQPQQQPEQAPQEQPGQGAYQQQQQQQPMDQDHTEHVRQSGDPTNPGTLAERLVRERQDRDRSWLRERFAGLERSVALFVASLYPGVGERRVAVRQRAAREAQESEERRRREEAERSTTDQEQNQEGTRQTLRTDSSEQSEKGVTKRNSETPVGSSSGVATESRGELRERSGNAQVRSG